MILAEKFIKYLEKKPKSLCISIWAKISHVKTKLVCGLSLSKPKSCNKMVSELKPGNPYVLVMQRLVQDCMESGSKRGNSKKKRAWNLDCHEDCKEQANDHGFWKHIWTTVFAKRDSLTKRMSSTPAYIHQSLHTAVLTLCWQSIECESHEVSNAKQMTEESKSCHRKWRECHDDSLTRRGTRSGERVETTIWGWQ